MGLQQTTDAVIKAYLICRKTMIILEQQHGPSMNMHESADGYVWTFADRTTVKLDKNGDIA